MEAEGQSFWELLGEAAGRFLAWVVDLAGAAWDGIGGAIADFFAGLARGVGVKDAGIFTWLGLGLGILLVLSAVQGFLRRGIWGPLFRLAFGLILIGVIIA